MWVVGENSACAQLDASQELHASSKHRLLGGLCAMDKQRREREKNIIHLYKYSDYIMQSWAFAKKFPSVKKYVKEQLKGEGIR